MKSDCLEFAEIPHSGQLFLDYLAQAPAATRFYGEQAPLTMPVARRSPEQRARIADVLERQHEAFGNSVQVSRNIVRLREGANVIVTGQQAGLFGGPLLAMLKTLTAIRLAEQSHAVPVFWIATTDHDLAEVDHVAVVSGGGLHTLRVALEAMQGAMVSRAKIQSLTADFAEGRGSGAEPTTDFAEGRGSGRELSIGVLGKMFPQADAEILGILESAYGKGERMGIAFARLWSHLFSRFGLLVIDPDDGELQRLAAPIYARAAGDAVALNDELRRRNKELEEAGYRDQVKVTEETSLLFADVEGARTPVRIVRPLTGGTAFRAGSLHWQSAQDLARWVEEQPERVTPNALLRPVVQDYLLPTLAYVGGPAEVAYFAQTSVLYDRLLGGRTPVVPRISATLIEPRIAEMLARYGMSFEDLLKVNAEPELAQELGRRVLPEGVGEAFAGSRASVEAQLEQLGEAVQRFDPTLAAAAETARRKMAYQLRKLEQRAARAQLRKETEIARHAAVLWNNLRPQGELQEREIGGIQYLLKHGPGILDVLYRELRMCGGHQVVGL